MKTAVNSISSYLQNWHHIPDEHEETMANGLTGGSTVGALRLCDGIMLEVALEPASAFGTRVVDLVSNVPIREPGQFLGARSLRSQRLNGIARPRTSAVRKEKPQRTSGRSL